MRRIGAAFAIVIAAFALCAAGPYSDRLSADELRHVKTVAIISVIGHSFLFQHVRDTSLEWLGPPDSHFLEISDWALDPQVTRETTAALAKHFAIKAIAFEPADFSTWNAFLLRRTTLDLNADPAIDAYVMILRDWRPDEIGGSVHALGGLGLYRRDFAHGPAKFGVFASYRVVVVDALTGAIIASRAAAMRDGSLPWSPAAPSLWPQTPNDLTDAQRAILDTNVTALIEATLPRTLAEMGLSR
jgi:hypothetical protein